MKGSDNSQRSRKLRSVLAYALCRCQPNQVQLAAQAETSFLRAVNEQLSHAGSRPSIALTDSYPRTLLTVTHPDGTPDHNFGRHRIWEDLVPEDDPLGIESWVNTILKHQHSQAGR